MIIIIIVIINIIAAEHTHGAALRNRTEFQTTKVDERFGPEIFMSTRI
jgi:hypothetical protein